MLLSPGSPYRSGDAPDASFARVTTAEPSEAWSLPLPLASSSDPLSPRARAIDIKSPPHGIMDHVFDELIGGFIGGELGLRLRSAYYRRKLSRACLGKAVRVRARLHRDGSPSWKYWRGTVVRKADKVVWRARVRRWRQLDLTAARVIGASRTSSAAVGDRVLLTLVGVPADHLAAAPEAAGVLDAIFVRHAGARR